MEETIKARARNIRRGPAGLGADLTIGQVSRRTGIPAKTIRYYEAIGLLPQPPRGANTYRRYSLADVNRLLLLRRIKLLGASIGDAKHLLEGVTEARCVDAQEALLSLVDSRLIALDRQMDELLALREQVSDYRRTLTSCRADDSTPFSDCSDMRCIDAFPDESAACAPAPEAGSAFCCSAR
ncbi:MAG TPA: MerR family transcriptional regulator [Ktedonobacterales bacterium]